MAVDIVEAPLQKIVAELQGQEGKVTACVANVAVDADVERMLTTAPRPGERQSSVRRLI